MKTKEEADELDDLERSLYTIQNALKSDNSIYEEQLIQKNKTLEEQYEYILESEKSASLGKLVAGVAHEINTPIGTGITLTSFLRKNNVDLKNKMAHGTLTKKELNQCIGTNSETLERIEENLNAAAALISSFKKLSVDNNSKVTLFNLHDSIAAVILSLRHEYKKHKYGINNNCPEDLMISSYPGAISQIMSNLLLNSIQHGFRGRDDGLIEIDVSLNDHIVTIEYMDDGCGMLPEVMDKMYEPFFTTRRDHGNSGLGMPLVFNIVNQQLGGTIKSISKQNKGVRFIIQFSTNV